MTRQTFAHTPDQIMDGALHAGRILNSAYADHRPLSASRRRALGGRYFTGVEDVVYEVARAMRGHGPLFARHPFDGDRLHCKQQTADAWRHLSFVLADLQAFANDQYLLAQSEATSDAMSVINQVRGELRLPLAGEDTALQERLIALLPAIARLRRHREAPQGKKAKKGPPRSGGGPGSSDPFAPIADDMEEEFAEILRDPPQNQPVDADPGADGPVQFVYGSSDSRPAEEPPPGPPESKEEPKNDPGPANTACDCDQGSAKTQEHDSGERSWKPHGGEGRSDQGVRGGAGRGRGDRASGGQAHHRGAAGPGSPHGRRAEGGEADQAEQVGAQEDGRQAAHGAAGADGAAGAGGAQAP